MTAENSVLLVIVLIAILVVSLAVNHYFHQREQRARHRQQQLRTLRNEIQQVADIMAAVKSAQAPAGLLQPLADYATHLIGQLAKLTPEAGVVAQLQGQTGLEPVAIPSGGHAVKRVQAALRRSVTMMSNLQRLGRISPIEFAEHKRELTWLYSQIEIDHFIREGQKLVDSGKSARAINHFKHAKSLAAKVSSKEPRRKDKLAEIEQLIANANPYKPSAAQDSASSSNENRG